MKLKRLVSAILAVGMALTMLPTAAFAADAPKHITGIVLTADGKVDAKASGGTENNNEWTPADKSWIYQITSGGNEVLKIQSGWTFDEDSTTTGLIQCEVWNYGTIAGGEFTKRILNVGTITGGTFTEISNRAYNGEGTAQVKGGITKKYSVEVKDGGILKDTIVWDSLTESTKGSVISGILPKMTNQIADTSKYYMVKAPGCTLTSTYNGQEFSIKDEMLVVGENETPEMTITVTPSSQERKIDHWEVTGISNYTGTDSITFTVPAGNTEEITVTAVREEIALTASNDLPVDGKNDDGTYGSSYDGWYYNETENNGETQKNLTIYSFSHSSENYAVNLGNEQVDWKVQNNGTIAGGKYTDVVRNYGKITGGTFTGKFSNNDAVEDKNSNATGEGTVESGVFSRSADFGTQNPDITWLNVNNGVVNDVEGFFMAGIVGKQTVTVKTTDANFTGWTVSGDSDLTLTEAQRTSKELTLTLDGSNKNIIVLTAMTPEDYQHFSIIDGKAYNEKGDEITSAKSNETVKLVAADAPEGMVFDRWEISPADVALTLEEGGFDSHAATASFKMPAQTLSIRAMYRMADQPEEPNVLGTVAMVATAGVGAAVVGYTGYMIGTELYLKTVLPDGVAIPQNIAELAKLVWTEAGKPAPAAVMAPDATDEQKALTWAIENQLISADKAADASVSRWEVIQTWNKAQEMKG